MLETIREQFFPFTINDQFVVTPVPDHVQFWGIASPVMEAIFPPFSDLGAYGFVVPEERREQAKALSAYFTQAHHESFVFKSISGEIVGFAYGDMRDSQTFFMTSTGILAPYRKQGIYTAFTVQLLKYLYAIGYERVLSNHHPNNRAVIIAKLKLGFNITAVNLDERWGSQVELTYLFEDERRDVYQSAFAMEKRPIPVSHQ